MNFRGIFKKIKNIFFKPKVTEQEAKEVFAETHAPKQPTAPTQPKQPEPIELYSAVEKRPITNEEKIKYLQERIKEIEAQMREYQEELEFQKELKEEIKKEIPEKYKDFVERVRKEVDTSAFENKTIFKMQLEEQFFHGKASRKQEELSNNLYKWLKGSISELNS